MAGKEAEDMFIGAPSSTALSELDVCCGRLDGLKAGE